eukprot:sb/3479472/
MANKTIKPSCAVDVDDGKLTVDFSSTEQGVEYYFPKGTVLGHLTSVNRAIQNIQQHLTINQKRDKVGRTDNRVNKVGNRVPRICTHKFDIGDTDILEAEIALTDDRSIALPPRRIPVQLLPKVREEIQALLDIGVIQPSQSPFSAPTVIVQKKGTSDVRICTDYRELNKKTESFTSSIPSLDVIVAQVGGKEYYTSLDLTKGYMSLRIKDSDKYKTAWNVPGIGLFEHNRLGFGIKNTPSYFCQALTMVFRHFPVITGQHTSVPRRHYGGHKHHRRDDTQDEDHLRIPSTRRVLLRSRDYFIPSVFCPAPPLHTKKSWKSGNDTTYTETQIEIISTIRQNLIGNRGTAYTVQTTGQHVESPIEVYLDDCNKNITKLRSRNHTYRKTLDCLSRLNNSNRVLTISEQKKSSFKHETTPLKIQKSCVMDKQLPGKENELPQNIKTADFQNKLEANRNKNYRAGNKEKKEDSTELETEKRKKILHSWKQSEERRFYRAGNKEKKEDSTELETEKRKKILHSWKQKLDANRRKLSTNANIWKKSGHVQHTHFDTIVIWVGTNTLYETIDKKRGILEYLPDVWNGSSSSSSHRPCTPRKGGRAEMTPPIPRLRSKSSAPSTIDCLSRLNNSNRVLKISETKKSTIKQEEIPLKLAGSCVWQGALPGKENELPQNIKTANFQNRRRALGFAFNLNTGDYWYAPIASLTPKGRCPL